jgi:beta-galactosidase
MAIGSPEHKVKGYKLYLSNTADNYVNAKEYNIPQVQPGESALVEVDDLFNGKGIVTVVRPTGTVASQKLFY